MFMWSFGPLLPASLQQARIRDGSGTAKKRTSEGGRDSLWSKAWARTVRTKRPLKGSSAYHIGIIVAYGIWPQIISACGPVQTPICSPHKPVIYHIQNKSACFNPHPNKETKKKTQWARAQIRAHTSRLVDCAGPQQRSSPAVLKILARVLKQSPGCGAAYMCIYIYIYIL